MSELLFIIAFANQYGNMLCMEKYIWGGVFLEYYYSDNEEYEQELYINSFKSRMKKAYQDGFDNSWLDFDDDKAARKITFKMQVESKYYGLFEE